MTREWVWGVLAIGFATVVAACVQGMNQPPMPQQARYVCENGKAFAVEFLADPPSARVVFDERQVTLPPALAATDAKYTDGQTTLYVEGDRALLETAGQVFGRGCVRR